MEKIIKSLQKEANKAFMNDEVPVSAVIVVDGKIISKAYNQKEKTNNIVNHAEIIAIRIAAKKLGSWKMPEAILYSSLEPCSLCLEAIKYSRIKEVIFFSEQNKKVIYKLRKTLIKSKWASDLLTNYFKNKR